MKKILLLTVFLMTLTTYNNVVANDIEYHVDLTQSHTKYVKVTMTLNNVKDKSLAFKMPVWTPGSYTVREFSRNVEQFNAATVSGESLSWGKTDKNTWQVSCKGNTVVVSYLLYANEVSVRTTFVDETQAFLHGTSVFMYAKGWESKSGKVHLKMNASWNQSISGLENDGNKQHSYVFDAYHELIDCPIQVGNFEITRFTVRMVPHSIAFIGQSNCETEKFTNDLKLLCEQATAVVGELDFKKYIFFVHHVEKGGGGLEHRNSTTVMMPRFNYSDKEKYEGFLSLCVHEYFHTWNVKRIRPVELGPFDFDKENYTKLLWVAEGITSYYDKVLMVRAGFWTKTKFLELIEGRMNYTTNTPGAEVQSLAEASFDAWIKFYRPDENSVNSSVSYYTKGAMAAALLDLFIIKHTNGNKNIDNLMKHLYQEFYVKKKRGFTEDEFKKSVESVAGKKADDFFNQVIYGKGEIDFAPYFETIGVKVSKVENKNPFIGLNTRVENGKTVVSSVLRNSPSFNAGITANDEIISINGVRVTDNYEKIFKESAHSVTLAGDNEPHLASLNFIISRNGLIKNITLMPQESSPQAFKLEAPSDKADAGILRKYKFWVAIEK
jgi:predicted metalloprotease with PDZ domain